MSSDDYLVAVFEKYKSCPFELYCRLLTYLNLSSSSSQQHDWNLEQLHIMFQYLYQESTTLQIWHYAFHKFNESNIIHELYPILASIRILTNIFGNEYNELFSIPKFYHSMGASLVNVFAQLSTSQYSIYNQVIESLNVELLQHFIEALLLTSSSIDMILLQCNNAFWNVNMLVISLQYLSKSPHESYYNLSSMKSIICHTCSTIPPQVLFERIFLKKTFNEVVAKVLVNTIPKSFVMDICYSVCKIWGDRLYISRGHKKSIVYLYHAIYACVERLDREDLMAPNEDDRKISLGAMLGDSIGNYFDVSDVDTRMLGMKLARLYALKLGRELKLVDLEQYEALHESSVKVDNVSKTSLSQPTIVPTAVDQTSEKDGEDSSEEEEENEFQPYHDEEFEPDFRTKTKYKRYYYLSVCLEKLKTREGDKDAYENTLNALHSIPLIVSSKPADAKSMCGLVFRELLRLTNSFNIETFDELRKAAIDSLLSTFPEHCGDVLQWALEDSDSLCIATKIEVVAAMVRAAVTLSDLKPSIKTNGSSSESAAPSAALESSTIIASKTTIRRPHRLAMLKKGVTRYMNRFVAVADTFQRGVVAALRKYFQDLAPKIQIAAHVRLDKGDSVDTLLPTQCLSSLIVFIECSLNHPIREKLAQESLEIAFALKESTSLSIRRSSLALLLAATSALLVSSQSTRTRYSYGPLEALTNISSISGESQLSASSPYLAAVAKVVEWCVESIANEPDAHCRVITAEMIKKAVEELESTKEL